MLFLASNNVVMGTNILPFLKWLFTPLTAENGISKSKFHIIRGQGKSMFFLCIVLMY
jgi:hypothetical protein